MSVNGANSSSGTSSPPQRRRASVDAGALQSVANSNSGANSGQSLMAGSSSSGPRGLFGSGNASQNRRPTQGASEPVVPVMPETRLTEFLEKSTFCAVLDPLLRELRLREQAAAATNNGPNSKEKSPAK
ncbi:unnamed protein product, partial [Amoebophrya sp. A25]|eukprot:GSA25T00025605001.1